MNNFEKTGFIPADILLPKDIDLRKWSVVACDQYTAQPEYWAAVEKTVGDSPSALHVVFPEIYLGGGDAERIANINDTMRRYLQSGMFRVLRDSFVYVERTVSGGKLRRGIVGAVDLEAYDYSGGAKSLVRATEKTVAERIPPRVNIRIDAPLELPHVLLLIDDPGNLVLQSADAEKSRLDTLYDFDLMQGGGRITGYHLPRAKAGAVADGLRTLAERSDLLFAVGDGNHSLAAAKTCWDMIKKDLSEEDAAKHPARYALAELVNIHDDSLAFEPIHRILFDCDPQNVLREFLDYYDGASLDCGGGQTFQFMYQGNRGTVCVEHPPAALPLGTLQKFLDHYTAKHRVKIDYIHGNDVLETLSAKPGNIGFALPAAQKSELFPTVIADGALPRKTFSMGGANEKRFYLECRKIKI